MKKITIQHKCSSPMNTLTHAHRQSLTGWILNLQNMVVKTINPQMDIKIISFILEDLNVSYSHIGKLTPCRCKTLETTSLLFHCYSSFSWIPFDVWKHHFSDLAARPCIISESQRRCSRHGIGLILRKQQRRYFIYGYIKHIREVLCQNQVSRTRQLITSHRCRGMSLPVPALDTCFCLAHCSSCFRK